MPKLRRLSGDDLIRIFRQFGFDVHSQRGSHVKLRCIGNNGHRQTLTVPRHRELDSGTLLAIFRQAGRFIPEPELWNHFYSE
jgi:predicted RNA binding protein YcfA (HicA-like mRNA interferase family)